MANPVITGSRHPDVYSSRNVDIIGEQLNIKILAIEKARFEAIYTIESGEDGFQIPLVFDTMVDIDSFAVWVDNVQVEVKNTYEHLTDNDINAWKDSLRNHFDITREHRINEFQYFEVDLPKGIHTIRVQYIARANIDKWGWVNKYVFEYNLEPARQWRSFKNLNVTIDATSVPYQYQVIFTDTTMVDSAKSWQFVDLPDKGITISYEPEINETARFLIALSPSGIMGIASLLVVILHLFFVVRYRKHHPQKKFSPIIFIGALIIPLIASIIFMWSYGLIYDAIGEHASRRSSYSFLIIPFLYIFVMPFYLLCVWIIDMLLKRKLIKKANQ